MFQNLSPLKIFHLIITIIASFFMIGLTKGIVSNDWVIFGSGILTFISVWSLLKKYREVGEVGGVVTLPDLPHATVTKPLQKPEKRPYKFIFTHDEGVLDTIEVSIENHPKVKHVFQDTGYWYSNGETGPEWFSMHVICEVEDADEVQNFIVALLKEKGFGHQGVNFMGSYN